MVSPQVVKAILDREAGKEVEGPEVEVYEILYLDETVEHVESDVQPPHRRQVEASVERYGELRACVWVSNFGHSVRMDLVRSVRRMAPGEVASLGEAAESTS